MRSRFLLVVLLALPVSGATVNVGVVGAGDKPVRDAVVYAIPPKALPLVNRTAVMDQIDRTFVPHVLPVQTGTWVEFPNSDNVRHQVFSVSPARRFSTPLYVGKPARPLQFPTAGVVALGCSVHEQMSAYIVVVDTPFFATTGEDGRALLNGIPAGRYQLKVWHPGMKGEPKGEAIEVAGDVSLTVKTALRDPSHARL
jgi:plastocyanin